MPETTTQDSGYRTTPEKTQRMPRGIPFIIGNEAAERFSFYGMRGILTIFMTEHLRNSAGFSDTMSNDEAKGIYHLFVGTAYFFPILGSLLADVFWGKYKTILILSLGYCIGHLCLAMGDTGIGVGLLEPRNWLFIGLIFIAIGSGGIKPCVSAHVGDQFGTENQGLLSKTFSWFYFSINVGAAASNLLTPYLLEHKDFGPAYAFGLPGVLMALATLLFWMGRNRFVHIPPAGKEQFLRETFDPVGLRALKNLIPLFLIFVPMFWSIFDQTGSAWVLQATQLDRQFLGFDWYEAQVQAVNPVLILILIPTFAYFVYPAMARFFEPTPLRKIGIGLFLTVVAFGVSGWIESQLTGGTVQSISSQANRDDWRGIHLVDGDPETAWLSAPVRSPEKQENDAPDFATQEVIIRLREYQAWTVDQVVVKHLPDELILPQTEETPSESKQPVPTSSHQPASIEVFAADAPNPTDGWTLLGSLEIDPGQDSSTLDTTPTGAKYVKLVLNNNNGGEFVGLSEVLVMAQAKTGSIEEQSPSLNVAALDKRPTIGWQFLAYFLLTSAEVMVSIVCLEFAYTQAPKKMKSFIMGIYFLGVSFGNFVTAGVNWFISNPDGTSKLEGVSYYQFFTYAMFGSAVCFVLWSLTYKGQTYIQGDEN